MPAWESSRLTENWLFVPVNPWDGAAVPWPYLQKCQVETLVCLRPNHPFPLSVTFHFPDSLEPLVTPCPPPFFALKCLSPVHRSQLSSVHWTFPYCRSYYPLNLPWLLSLPQGLLIFTGVALFPALCITELNFKVWIITWVYVHLNTMLFLCISTSCIPYRHPWLSAQQPEQEPSMSWISPTAALKHKCLISESI